VAEIVRFEEEQWDLSHCNWLVEMLSIVKVG
jgi:hypothetical protein